MNRAWEAGKTILVFMLIAGLVVVWPWLNAKAVANCAAINANRQEGQNRAYVLKQLLITASSAREHSGELEMRTAPRQASIDLAAAAKYQELAKLVHDLPLRNC